MNKLFNKNLISAFMRGILTVSLFLGFPVAVAWALWADTLWPYYVYFAFIVIFPACGVVRQSLIVKKRALVHEANKSHKQCLSFKRNKKYHKVFYS
ncbi:hypothetical protein SG34_031050 [Thalassomonas viridans]|uniref:Uncharacterized protein n=1 Tax=Thalassomonas viridans TaxID=137584 RepID=A0AAE9ZBB4_9GAMM|nr:hypothetical protein [Thalassomonas viridans]WDE09204.1 hypothetical protein SG34_031050 [Thalassomonas viridans]